MNERLSLPDFIQHISQNRTELMGIATLSVFVHHINCYLGNIEWCYRLPFEEIQNWIFTDGFLFLSGFGVYYSLGKTSDYLSFYYKRLKRLYLPFLIIAGPFITFLTISHNESFWIWLARMTTINFWIEGNLYGMWYISVTMAFYFLSPLLFRIMNRKMGYVYWTVMFICVVYSLDYAKRHMPAEDFDHYKWIVQSPSFLMGMLVAKLKDAYKSHTALLMLLFILFTPWISFYSSWFGRFSFISSTLYRLYILLVFTFIISYLKLSKHGGGIINSLKFVGNHSLELYIIHLFLFCTLSTINQFTDVLRMFISIVVALIICSPIKSITNKAISIMPIPKRENP